MSNKNVTYRLVLENGEEETSTPSNNSDPKQGGKPNAKNPVSPLGKFSKLAGVAIAANTAKQVGGFAISNVGKFTGSSYAQSRVDTGMAIAGYTAQIAASPIMGSISLITSLATKLFNDSFDRRMERLELNQQRARVGLTPLKGR